MLLTASLLYPTAAKRIGAVDRFILLLNGFLQHHVVAVNKGTVKQTLPKPLEQVRLCECTQHIGYGVEAGVPDPHGEKHFERTGQGKVKPDKMPGGS